MNKKKIAFVTIIAVVVVAIVVVMCLMIHKNRIIAIEAENRLQVTKVYNDRVDSYNELLDEFNACVADCSIDNISGIGGYEKLDKVSEDNADIRDSFDKGNTIDTVKKDIETIDELMKMISNDIVIVKQIKNPSQEWVINKLDNIEETTEKGAVTLETDKNAMLGKEGGYTSCVYFGLQDVDATTVPGTSIVDKGTDAGGAIEVYATASEALARCEYLEEYEGTVLAPGSYAVIGTMVVRISYKLSAEQQLELTDMITKEFTKVE